MLHAAQIPDVLSWIPQIRHNGSSSTITRFRQSAHQREPGRPQPPQTGGKSRSNMDQIDL
jgi:hypothetical protein